MAKAKLIDGVVVDTATGQPIVGQTDWQRVRALGDDEIERLAREDTEAPPMSDEEWARAVDLARSGKRAIGLRLDADIIDWFKASGPGYQTRINTVLRGYMTSMSGAGKRG
jgi:uncharacterized protein (DUF4415 family)